MGLAALETEHGDPLGAFDSVTLVISNCQICAFPCRTRAHVITYFAASKLDGSPSSSGECLGSALTCEGEGLPADQRFCAMAPEWDLWNADRRRAAAAHRQRGALLRVAHRPHLRELLYRLNPLAFSSSLSVPQTGPPSRPNVDCRGCVASSTWSARSSSSTRCSSRR